jgi:hypothetical protein
MYSKPSAEIQYGQYFEEYYLLGHYSVHYDRSLLMFWRGTLYVSLEVPRAAKASKHQAE